MKDYDYNLHNSRLVSLNYWSKIKFNNRHIRYMNKNFICVSDCKKKFYQFCLDNNIENLTPKTYNSIQQIEDKSIKYYVKITWNCAQVDMIRGDYNFIIDNIDKYAGKSIVIQEKNRKYYIF